MFSKKDLQRLIIPLIIEQFLAITIGMADTVMVSGCGEAAVSGVSLVDAINILLINIFSAPSSPPSTSAERNRTKPAKLPNSWCWPCWDCRSSSALCASLAADKS